MEKILEMKDISKSFGGVQALDNVNISVEKGEIHAIVGENGAGKSTLMKSISGALQPDSGTIKVYDKVVDFNKPKEAFSMGISIVYQEPTFFPELTVTENFFINNEITDKFNNIKWGKMNKETAKALEKFDLDPEINEKRMSELTIGTQQLVLISKAIYQNANILILDEPTSILSQDETDRLFKTIKKLKKQGTSILYISHRLEEIFEIADKVTVIRNGKVIDHMNIEEADEDDLVRKMSGKHVDAKKFDKEKNKEKIKRLDDKPSILKVENLTKKNLYKDINFEVRPGEILGFYGLVGSGRSEIARSIFGDINFDQGEIEYQNEEISINSTREAIDNGIAYLPEDRGTQGIFPIMSVLNNISSAIISWLAKYGFITDEKKEREISNKYYNDLSIKSSSIDAPVNSLSGGNQQKVVLARWLAANPNLLILDEPTRGIDVATKSEVHDIIFDLAKEDIALICISSDLNDILTLSDRIMVMHEGEIKDEFTRNEANEEKILRSAIGM